MSCIARLVDLYGTQAGLARRLSVDRAVVSNWVKVGYIPARWAMEVEHATEGEIAAVDILNEADDRALSLVAGEPGQASKAPVEAPAWITLGQAAGIRDCIE